MRKEKQSSAILHKRVDSIEFWRFFFCSCIVVMHFSETFQSKLYGEVRFGILPGAGLGVDFFFILSGYLMMDSYIRGGEKFTVTNTIYSWKDQTPLCGLLDRIFSVVFFYCWV